MPLPKDSLATALRWIPALLLASLIFVFSATPGKQVARSFNQLNTRVVESAPPAAPSAETKTAAARRLPESVDWLKVGHGIGYFCLGASVLFGTAAYSGRGAVNAQIVCSLYAITDEFHQNFTPGRSASAWDMLLDSLAACGGILFLYGLVKLRQRFSSRTADS
ncbi:MAG: VanZ family protein [Anaerolineales bacterium]|jgi:VanZ family protein|nr:VanZ family protein [Anaerolineales bacterium]